MVLSEKKIEVDNIQLWNKFKDGCELSFSNIFHEYYSVLYNYGYKLTADEDLTKDSIQELFITIWNNRENLGEAKSIKFYLLKALRRKIIKVLKFKRKKFEHKIKDNYEFEVVFSVESLIISEQLQNEQQEYFFKLLNSLSKRQKEAIYLKFYQNLSYEEISEIMDVNYQSIRNFVHRGITTLRKNVKESAGVLLLLLSSSFTF